MKNHYRPIVCALMIVLFSPFYSFSENETSLTASVKDMEKEWIHPKTLSPPPTEIATPAPKKWKIKGNLGFNAAQTSLTNWSAGGDNSISGNGLINLDIQYKNQKHSWNTQLNTEYGLMYTASAGLNKTVDNIFLGTKYGYEIVLNHWFFTVLASLQTQYDKGFVKINDSNYISEFMAPGYLNTSVGIEYKLKDLLSVNIAPLTGRTTFVCDKYLSDLGAFGVKPGKRSLFELGFSINANVKWPIRKNIILSSTLDLFTPYNKDFGNIVVNWDVLLVLKVNKFLNATIGTTLKYDDKVKTVNKEGAIHGAKVQFKEMITVGIAYMFNNETKRKP
ncbi:MAG: DUF3078 domain-containing protein [Bacteroidales bacterium]